MKFLFDIFPILLFFVAFKFFGIYVATAVAMGATILQVLYLLAFKKKIEYMLWVNLGIITFFGGLTIFLHNEIFIKWKPTILYAFFATALLISDLYFKKNLMKTLIQSGINIPDSAWKVMNFSWAGFFGVLAVLNLFVAYTFPTETWVNFKLFGLVGITFLFVIIQSFWLARFASQNQFSQD